MTFIFRDHDKEAFKRLKAAVDVAAEPLVVVDNGPKWRDLGHEGRYAVMNVGLVAEQPEGVYPIYGYGVDESKRWYSPVSDADDFGEAVTTTVIDGATTQGPWGLMTPDSHRRHGRGLGVGRGQMYRLRPDGVWIKVEG